MRHYVSGAMAVSKAEPNGFPSTLHWLNIGAGTFLLALLISASSVPDLRIFHLSQAVIYVAVVRLARRKSAWGCGAGFSVAIPFELDGPLPYGPRTGGSDSVVVFAAHRLAQEWN